MIGIAMTMLEALAHQLCEELVAGGTIRGKVVECEHSAMLTLAAPQRAPVQLHLLSDGISLYSQLCYYTYDYLWNDPQSIDCLREDVHRLFSIYSVDVLSDWIDAGDLPDMGD